jgi:hypothetical protein
MSPEDIVKKQLDACTAKDLEAFMSEWRKMPHPSRTRSRYLRLAPLLNPSRPNP